MSDRLSLWRSMHREANRAFRRAENEFILLTGSALSQDERYRQAGFHRPATLYALLLEELERGVSGRGEERVKFYRQGALVFACAGQLDHAWHCIERLLALRTQKNDQYYFLEGFLHLRARDWEKALVCYEHALELNDRAGGGSAYILCHQATCLQQLGRLDEAFERAQEAVRIAPKKPVPWEIYTQICGQTNRESQARRGQERIHRLLAQKQSDNASEPGE